MTHDKQSKVLHIERQFLRLKLKFYLGVHSALTNSDILKLGLFTKRLHNEWN